MLNVSPPVPQDIRKVSSTLEYDQPSLCEGRNTKGNGVTPEAQLQLRVRFCQGDKLTEEALSWNYITCQTETLGHLKWADNSRGGIGWLVTANHETWVKLTKWYFVYFVYYHIKIIHKIYILSNGCRLSPVFPMPILLFSCHLYSNLTIEEVKSGSRPRPGLTRPLINSDFCILDKIFFWQAHRGLGFFSLAVLRSVTCNNILNRHSRRCNR